MKVFARFDYYGGSTPDIEKLYLGINRDVVEAEVNNINKKVGGGVDFKELDVDVVCDEEVLSLFDDTSLLEELKRRKVIQMEMDKRLIQEIEGALKKKKFEVPAGAISERDVLEVLRLQDDYYAGDHDRECTAQEYIIKHWNN